DSWAKEWLQTAGVNTLAPTFELADDGSYTSFAVRQTAHPEWPTLRRHRIGIGLYDAVVGENGEAALVRRDRVEIDVHGELTEVPELVGIAQPDLLLLNDDDLTYAKIRLDERSLSTAVESLGRLDDSLARALCWGAAWDMTRDAEMRATDFVDLVLRNIASETDAWGLAALPRFAALATNFYSAPANRDAVKDTWEQGLRRLLGEAAPGSDHQLTFARHLAGSARSSEVLDEIEGLLDGSVTFEGLDVDQDLRWVLVTGLARAGRIGGDRIAAELERDQTISGREHAAAARAAQPTAEAKAAAWRTVLDPDTPNETSRSIVLSFMRPDQQEVLEPYVDAYLEAADTLWDVLGPHKASVAVEYLFPKPLGSPELLTRVDEWLATTDAGPGAKRYVTEGRADVVRALAAQERDARG
ncbi:ERAP1-like C-terminal domain-containing protein, partial [Nocardioides sp.]|uniref:ERAP1-like C-terminal domain-containing protein n=1 Tax=Nocardioides sp. TaxID=35761 RepID=UPI002ED1B70A